MTGGDPTAGRQVTWDELDALVSRLADAVGRDFDLLLAISRGGLVPAGMLAYRLDLREIAVAGAVFYLPDGATRDAPGLFQFPDPAVLADKRILVVDEVWETGETITAVLDRVRDAGGRPTSAVLHYKPGRSRVMGSPDHFAAVEDGWLNYPYKYDNPVAG